MSYSKNVAINVVSQISITATTFLTTIFTTRMLTDVGRGEWALYSNFISLAVLFFGLSLTTGLIYQIASKNLSLANAIKVGILYPVAATIIFAAAVSAMFSMELGHLVVSHENQTSEVLVTCVAAFLLTTEITILTSILNGIKKVFVVNVVTVVTALCGLTFFAAVYFSGYATTGLNAFLFVIRAQVAFQIVQCVILLVILLRENRLREELFWGHNLSLVHLRSLFGYSLLIYAANLVMFFTYKLDFWFVTYYVGKAGLGVYSLAVMLSQLVWLLPNAISLINLTEVSENPNAGIEKTLYSFKIAGILSVLVAASFWIFCAIMVPIIYGTVFSDVPGYMIILFIGVIPFAPLSIISSYLAGINKYVGNLMICLVGVVTCVSLDIWLIPIYGITGACVASACSYLVISILLIYYFSRVGQVSLKEILILDRRFFEMARSKIVFLVSRGRPDGS